MSCCASLKFSNLFSGSQSSLPLLPCGFGCTSQPDQPKNSQNSWNTKEKKARDQGIVQKHHDVKCKVFFAEKAQGFLW